MITATEEGKWDKKLKGLVEELKAAGKTDAVIKPTIVLRMLSEMKGRAVLAIISKASVERVKSESKHYVEKAIEGKREGWEGRAASAYRRWAYRFIEELLVEVRDKRAWGTVTSEVTLKDKRRPAKEGGVGKGVPPESWGVRHVRPDWRKIQKGQAKAGKFQPEKTESGKLIKVVIEGREIG